MLTATFESSLLVVELVAGGGVPDMVIDLSEFKTFTEYKSEQKIGHWCRHT